MVVFKTVVYRIYASIIVFINLAMTDFIDNSRCIDYNTYIFVFIL